MADLPYDPLERVPPVDFVGGLFDVEPQLLAQVALDFYLKHLEGTSVSDSRLGDVRFTREGRKAFEKLPDNRLRMSTVKALRELARNAVATEATQDTVTGVVPFRVDGQVYALKLVFRKAGDKFQFEDFAGYGMPGKLPGSSV